MGCFAGHGASASRDEDSKKLLQSWRARLQSRSTPRRGASCARTLHARPPCASRAAPGRAAAFARRAAPREAEHRFTLRRQARPSMAARGKPRFRGGRRPRRPALPSCRFAPQKRKGSKENPCSRQSERAAAQRVKDKPPPAARPDAPLTLHRGDTPTHDTELIPKMIPVVIIYRGRWSPVGLCERK